MVQKHGSTLVTGNIAYVRLPELKLMNPQKLGASAFAKGRAAQHTLQHELIYLVSNGGV